MSTVSFYIFDYCKQILHKYAYVNATNAVLYIIDVISVSLAPVLKVGESFLIYFRCLCHYTGNYYSEL